ncbi:MAG: hypothetical protein LUC17_02670 [Oscillospiraceae bacterium]|nr:hypothetical protein [Oscillospiraceae bacterium]
MRVNIQALARQAISDALGDVTVRTRVPNPRPEQFVLVRREGGGLDSDRHRDFAGIGIDCWATSEQKAYELAEACRAEMLNLAYVHGAAAVDDEAFYSSPDPEDSTPRWYGSYTVITYEINL